MKNNKIVLIAWRARSRGYRVKMIFFPAAFLYGRYARGDESRSFGSALLSHHPGHSAGGATA